MSSFGWTMGVLVAAGLMAAAVGLGSATMAPLGRQRVVHAGRDTAIEAGFQRRRLPQPGDSWAGCHHARAAGTAPIHRGEPGYSPGMDGDGDGIACKPVRS